MAPMVRLQSSLKATPPPKSLLRKSTLVAKRKLDDADLEMDDEEISAPLNPAKRARMVTFNPLVQEQLFTSAPEIPAELEDVRRTVRRALNDHLAADGDDALYDTVKEIFSTKSRTDSAVMRAHLVALTSSVSLLGRNCSGLVKAVLDSDWIGRDDTYVKTFVGFLGNLVIAQGSYIGSVLGRLVAKFERIQSSEGRLPDMPIVTPSVMSLRVHFALKYFLRLIPAASANLMATLASKYPFADEPKKVHTHYISQLLQVLEYAPELRSDIFALITEKLVKIDVQMQVNLDDMDDDIAAAIVQSLNMKATQGDDAEEDSDDSDSESDASEDSDDDEDDPVKMMQDNVEKMDAILDILFELYTPYFQDPYSPEAISMFDTLLSHFRNIILPTYRSRHTQFLLFHFAQTSEHLIDTFAGECVDLAFKSGRPAVLKQSAAAYLASFVSRGAHVTPQVVRDVFDYIGANLDVMRSENEVSCRGPDLQRYGTFYATTQALLYIFCFRWRDLVVTPSSEEGEIDDEDFIGRDLEWRPGVKELLDRTICSKLNPLKVCAPVIVEEFARIAHHLRFMYVYPLLEKNKRVRLSQFALGASNSGVLRDSGHGTGAGTEEGELESWHQLDAYFPFDPYQLPKSRRWVENDYVEWKDIPGLHQDEEDDTTDADEEDEDEDADDIELDTATDEE